MPRVKLPRRLARCLARYAEAAGKPLGQAAERCLELALAEQRLEAALDGVVERQKQISAAAERRLEAALDGVVKRQKQISAAAERRLEAARQRLARLANERVRDFYVGAGMGWTLYIDGIDEFASQQ